MLGEALTEEERRRYQKQCNAVLAQHKILKAQYHLVCGGRVSCSCVCAIVTDATSRLAVPTVPSL